VRKNQLQKDNMKIGEENIIAMIINNFIIRPFSLDVFLLRIFLKNFAIDKKYIIDYKVNCEYVKAKKELLNLLQDENYLLLASFILDDIEDKHIIEALDTIINYYIKQGLVIDSLKIINAFKLLLKKNWQNIRVKLLSKLIYFKALLINKQLGKNL
jgi:hypothetical protein